MTQTASPQKPLPDADADADADADGAGRPADPGHLRTAAGFRGRGGMLGTIAKIVLLGLFDAFALWLIFVMAGLHLWVPLVITVVITLVINWIYVGKSKRLPGKYLTPGVIFLVIFQIFVVFFSGYIAFTNYSDGHNSTKADAIAVITLAAQKRVPDSPTYAVNILQKGGELYLLVTDPDGTVRVGSSTAPLTEAKNPKLDGTGTANGLSGFETLTLHQVLASQQAITAIAVPLTSDPLTAPCARMTPAVPTCTSRISPTTKRLTPLSLARVRSTLTMGRVSSSRRMGKNLARGGKSTSASRISPKPSPTLS